MARDKSSGKINIAPAVHRIIYQTQIINPNDFGSLRESYLQWGAKMPDKDTGSRYFWYRDGDKIYKIGAIETNYADYYLWKDNGPGTPGFPTDVPNQITQPPPVGTAWTQSPGPDPATQSTFVSTTPHTLVTGDKVTIGSPTDGTATTGTAIVVSPTEIVIDRPTAETAGWKDYDVYKHTGSQGYMTYIDNGVLYIRYWDPEVQNPDGTFGAYVTTLPKASILDQKIEYVYDTEAEVPDPANPPSISPAMWYRHIPVSTSNNTNGDALYEVVMSTVLTIHSAIRYNSHILRPATAVNQVGINGEYYWQNDTPRAGNATVTIARKPQVGDFVTTMF